MPSKGSCFALTAALAVVLSMVASPASADATTVNVSAATESGGVISVTGAVVYGTDATANLVLGTDTSGDAVGSAPGLDLTSISVRPNVAGRQLIWTLSVGNGLPDPVGGPAPVAMGYQVPIMVDGDDKWRWLAAATAVSGNAQAGKWTALCHNEVNGAQGGWSCPGTVFGSTGAFTLTGAITSTGVTWTQGFNQMKPVIQYGSVVEASSILCGRPCSFAFPPGLATGGLAPIDVLDVMNGYKVPGQISLAIAPVGAPAPGDSAFSNPTTFNGATGAFTGSLSSPGTGAYTVWARTCFGLSETPTCALGSRDITI